MPPPSLTDAQLRAELERCRSCETRPCRSGCPAGCSPGDFILAARCGEPSDWRRAAAHVLGHNPLGGVCGAVCPESLCMARCARRAFDAPVEIPAIQAAIVQRARQLGVLPRLAPLPATGHRVAIVGAGPAGLGAASVLAKAGHAVHVFDRARRAGGMARLIPRSRLDPAVLEGDVAWLLALGDVRLVLGRPVALPRDLLARGFAAVIVAAGLGEPAPLDVPGHERAHPWTQVLGSRPPPLRGRRVAVVGDGAVALDCAEAALAQGAAHVEVFARKSLSELELGRRERDRLFASGLHVSCRVRVTAIRGRGRRTTGLALRKVRLPPGEAFHPSRLADLPHGAHERRDLDAVVLAIGGEPGLRLEPHPRIFYAGDLEAGPATVVEALASGKRAGLAVHAMLAGDDVAACPDRASCADGAGCPKRATCPEWNAPESGRGPARARAPAGLPVPLATDFFGRPLRSPFLLAAGPHTDGAEQVLRAYAAGWAGAVMGVAVGGATGPTLDRVCRDVERLVREFPDRLTMVALAGTVAGGGDGDGAREAAARALTASGAMGIEHQLPRGADPGGPARFAEAVLAAGDPAIPALFAPGGDTAAGDPVFAHLAAAFARRPERRAGVALAGGISDAARAGLCVIGCGEALDYRGAAAALAAGARHVRLGRIVARHGLGVVHELHAGLSYFLAERGLGSVPELVASSLAAPASAADAAATEERVCELDRAACTGCGNCSRCPHLAIALDGRGTPSVDRARCVGCGTCVEVCFTGALALRSRSALGAGRVRA